MTKRVTHATLYGDDEIAAISVKCTYCGAQVGESCWTSGDRPASSSHRIRIRVGRYKVREARRLRAARRRAAKGYA